MTHTVGPRETAWLLPALQVGSDDSHCRLSIWHGLGAWKSDFSAITMYSPCTWNLRFVVPPKRDVVGLCWFISPLTIHLYHHNISAVSPRNIGVINQVNYLGGTTFFLGKDGAKMDRHWIWSQEDDEGWDSVSMKQMAGLVNVQKTMEYHHL